MPHLCLTVSAQLRAQQHLLLSAGHRAMLDSGLFQAHDIKSRLWVTDDFLVGDGSDDAFVHAAVQLLDKPERTEAVQKNLAAAIMQAVQQVLPAQTMAVQLSCDVAPINPQIYAKHRIVPAAAGLKKT